MPQNVFDVCLKVIINTGADGSCWNYDREDVTRSQPVLVDGTVMEIPVFLPPERGLPSRERQIPKSLILSVCLFVWTDSEKKIFGDRCAGFIPSFKALIFQGSKIGPVDFCSLKSRLL